MQKQRYGYYNLIHFRSTLEALEPLERIYRLSERVIRYLTVRFDKEEELTGFTRLADDESPDEEREGRRRGGRRSKAVRARARKEEPRTTTEPAAAGESGEAAVATEHDGDAEAAEPASEETC